ncbi:restriction endonuclease subunit S [Flavobacterium gilvum]|uniref:Type I restriction modification DNA specificity domain-containing protein n=1 Tax=Flavobacterium gilvum TaxID=1492737 RepID=A0AAC9N7S7_9FLAO|nr:restriction endonuclease subunit S [Flavobacterium gilvum]AOW11008.1 hypothetical protein EM308_16790 [Flavobacterium gilvum]KFC59197.1 type I restriction-modification system DNA specificity subunit [Flavobacterium gilvum]
MREGWKEYLLGDLITIKHGYGFKGEFFVDEPNKNLLLTPGNFAIGGGFKSDKMKYYEGPISSDFVLSAGDVIVTMTDLSKQADTLGFSARIPNDPKNVYLHNQRIGLVSLKNHDCDLEFIYWLLRTHSYQRYIAGSSSGATVKHTSPAKIYSAKVQIPKSKVTQRKIASILSAYDDLIENNLKRIKLLEEKAQLTYEEWFVKMRFPGHETAKFDEETGLPEGWEKKTIGDVCKVSGGGTPSRTVDEYWDGGDITWFSPTDLSKANSLCVLDSSQKITEFGLKKSSAKLLDTNSFMMTSRATIGLFALINKPFTTNQGFINVTPTNEFDKGFLIYNFKYRVEEFKSHATGATFPELSKSKFNALDIIWPNEESLKLFSEITSVIHTQLFNLTKQNHLLNEARDILLPRLMSGMIDVEEIQTTVEEMNITNAEK